MITKQCGDHLWNHHRVSTNFEKIVSDTDVRPTQHCFPSSFDYFFGRGRWSHRTNECRLISSMTFAVKLIDCLFDGINGTKRMSNSFSPDRYVDRNIMMML